MALATTQVYAYDSTYGQAAANYLLDSGNQVTIWRKELLRESEKLRQFAPFSGEGALNLIRQLRELEAKQGLVISIALMKNIPLTQAPFQGDRDTHALEYRLRDAAETVTLKEWRLPSMTGRAQKQRPMWNYDAETELAIRNYVAKRKDWHTLATAMGVSVNDGEDTPVAIYTGEPPTNIVYPAGTTSLAEILPSHKLTIEHAARAAERMETGYAQGTTQVFTGTPPVIGGQEVRGVFFISPYCKYDLRYEDTHRYEGWLSEARERGINNPIWQGIPDKFMVDGILYVTLRSELAKQMLYTTAPWATGSDITTPGCQVALNVFMTAQAICRATSIEDILDFEQWDGNQFTRVIGGSFEGYTKTRFNRSDSSNAKDWGVVVCPAAAIAHD